MGTMVGHVGPGLGFLAVGLWHLVNHMRLHCKNPRSYASPPWFPSSVVCRHLELYLIMVGSCISIAMELFIGPSNHQPLDPSDWSIPSNHLHNLEHASISLTFLCYAAFAVVLDRTNPPAAYALTQLLAAAAFSQQLLLFHLHSTDHMGVEGQYHWLLQLVIAVSLLTTLIGVRYDRSFSVSFVRSTSIVFQGVWLVVMGVMLWTPAFMPKGCFMNHEHGHFVVRCRDDHALHRAKSMVNIQFTWYFVATVALVTAAYLLVARASPSDVPEYLPLTKTAAADNNDAQTDNTTGGADLAELQTNAKLVQLRSFAAMDKEMVDLER